nr:MAG TPA: hypothetical protein [Crassvirales sp.]
MLLICCISSIIYVVLKIWISKSVTVKCSGNAVNVLCCSSPRIRVPVKPFFQVVFA